MAIYLCTKCGQPENTGWTDYYIHLSMGLPVLCAGCDPRQRCHWHNEATSQAQKKAEIGEIDP